MGVVEVEGYTLRIFAFISKSQRKEENFKITNKSSYNISNNFNYILLL